MAKVYQPLSLGLVAVMILTGCNLKPNVATTTTKPIELGTTPLNQRNYRSVSLGANKLNVEVVNTPASITLGLSYRDQLGADGMLFELPSRSQPSFWMKEMKFALDMIWIDCGDSYYQNSVRDINCAVVSVSENAIVEPDPANPVRLYSPTSPVTHVLEMASGWSQTHGIKPGVNFSYIN